MSKPDLFAASKADWQDKARATARQLLRNRDSITIEDVTVLCPLPRYLNRNTIGKVFQHPDFKAIGYVSAKRPSSNGRTIKLWTLANSEPKRTWYGGERDSD